MRMPKTWYEWAGLLSAGVMVVSLLVGPGIAGLVWLVRLDTDVEHLQADMQEVKEAQQEIIAELGAIRGILNQMRQEMGYLQDEANDQRADFENHSHSDEDGGVVIRPRGP